jgi:conjugative transposon TraM protein
MNEKQIKTRRFYLVLPLLVLPFVTIAFWLMGGGANASNAVVKKSGMNTALPDADNAKDSGRDKMSFYEMANADSAKRSEQLRNDPNFKGQPISPMAEEERQISQSKVHAIRERIKIPEYHEPVAAPVENYMPPRSVQPAKQQVDPDLEAINQTIEKLAALQNPVKPAEKNLPEVRKEALSVNTSTTDEETYFGKKTIPTERKQFFNDIGSEKKLPVSFPAVVPTEQVLQNGSVIKLQLKQSIMIAGALIPAGTTVHGSVAIENERLFVQISSIQFANSIYPVALSVFDLDGIEGLHVPGSIPRDVVKSTAEQSLQSVNVLSLDPSIKTQALSAGIGAAKNLLSRKVKVVRATIPAGYGVLLRDNKAN